MRDAGGRLSALRGWRAALAVAAGGGLAALAMPPWHLWPVLLLSLPLLVLALRQCGGPLAAFALGWLFGFCFHLAGLNWIGNAFLVDAERFAALRPLAVSALPAGLALFTGLATLLARLAARDRLLVFTLPLAWLFTEWLRHWLFTGFPWNELGHAFAGLDASLQGAAWIGQQGLTLLAVLAGMLPAVLLWFPRRPALAALAAGILAVGALHAGGAWRLSLAPEKGSEHADLRLRLVQAAIPQKQKWQRDRLDAHVANYLDLISRPALFPPDLVILPETATPFLLDRDTLRRRQLALALPARARLISGAPRFAGTDEARRLHNAIHVIAADGSIEATYDKHHLVPFGEYLPLRGLLARLGLDKLAVGKLDYASGPGPRLLDIEGIPPFQPLVCYEAIFPAEVGMDGAAAWLLNLTNDAWFGDTPGPRQHLAAARMRAVEQGVPMVRAANTGISAVFDAWGRELGRLEVDERGVLDVRLPRALVTRPPYARYGEAVPAALWVLVLAGWLAARRLAKARSGAA